MDTLDKDVFGAFTLYREFMSLTKTSLYKYGRVIENDITLVISAVEITNSHARIIANGHESALYGETVRKLADSVIKFCYERKEELGKVF